VYSEVSTILTIDASGIAGAVSPSQIRIRPSRGCRGERPVRLRQGCRSERLDKKRRQPRGTELTPELGLRGRGGPIFDPLFRFHHQSFRADDAPERATPLRQGFSLNVRTAIGPDRLPQPRWRYGFLPTPADGWGSRILPRQIFGGASQNVDEARHSFRADECAGALDQHNRSEEKEKGTGP
jgi:hypothetical protein